MNNGISTNLVKAKLRYQGSLFWLVFWIIVFFPVALVLFFTNFGFSGINRELTVHYDGSRFWVCFWTIFFFPIAILMILFNGFSISLTETAT